MTYEFTLSKALKHWKVVRKHRKYVRQYCFKAHMYKQGLLHDLSKYSPTEFIESVKYFTGTHSPIDECKKVNGYSTAWMHHRSHNKHHREYWTDNYDKGTTCVKMPFKYALECFCDYLGAGRAYNKGVESIAGEVSWWKAHRSSMKIHEDTLFLLDCLFVLYQYHTANFLTNSKLIHRLDFAYSCEDDRQLLEEEISRATTTRWYAWSALWSNVGRSKDERHY